MTTLELHLKLSQRIYGLKGPRNTTGVTRAVATMSCCRWVLSSPATCNEWLDMANITRACAVKSWGIPKSCI